MNDAHDGSQPDRERIMPTLSQTTADDTLQQWLRHHPEGRELAEVAGLLRATLGGGVAAPADPADVSAWLDHGTSKDRAMDRLCTDPALRRQVAATARLLRHVSPRAARHSRWGRWSAGALLVAASLGAVVLLPRLGPTAPDGPAHRAGTITAADVHVLSPAGVLPTAPKVEWRPVLGADLYEVEVTGPDGSMIFTQRTTDTALQIPPDTLLNGVRHFFRVRARVSVGRWVASDFTEFVVQP